MPGVQTKLSSTVTVAKYRALVQSEDRPALRDFVCERFSERYFRPIDSTPPTAKHGFLVMAIACLVVETLESFYQGRGDTRGKSKEMFQSFFERKTALNVFADSSGWFYTDIRCGILHQGEARNGWKVLRSGPLIDRGKKCINATKFLLCLRMIVNDYAEELLHNEARWHSFKRKMEVVCANCFESP